MTDEELYNETLKLSREAAKLSRDLDAKKEELTKTRDQLAWQQNAKIVKVLNKEIIDAFVPNHSREKCLYTNSSHLTDHGTPLCMRCYLLNVLTSKYIDLDIQLTITGGPRAY